MGRERGRGVLREGGIKTEEKRKDEKPITKGNVNMKALCECIFVSKLPHPGEKGRRKVILT